MLNLDLPEMLIARVALNALLDHVEKEEPAADHSALVALRERMETAIAEPDKDAARSAFRDLIIAAEEAGWDISNPDVLNAARDAYAKGGFIK